MIDPTFSPAVSYAVLSNATLAAAIGLVAWVGSRLYRCPSLWHAVWVLAMVRLFLPPVWSVPTPLVPAPAPVTLSIASSSATPVEVVQPNAITASKPSIRAEAPPAIPVAAPSRLWSLTQASWGAVVVGVWALGSMAVFVASVLPIVHFHALVRRARTVESATDSLVEAAADLGDPSRRPQVCFVDHTAPPLLWPLGWRPMIVLPTRWWRATPGPERSAVLMHELVHWRRGDHWVRLLHWVASVVFWWHPLVWIARGELHRLEEECCDAEVMHRLPGAGRAYASALLSAAQWLDGAPLLAMRMAHSAQFDSFHRRIQMLPTLSYRPWTRRHMLAVALAAALPLTIGLGASAQQGATTALRSDSATLTGKVTDPDGKPIAGAKVRVVVPTADLRFPLPPGKHREAWGETDDAGAYSVDVPGVSAETTASVDMFHPGHTRLVGTLMRSGFPNKVTLAPGKNSDFNAELPSTLYFAGQVIDEQGGPIEGVRVSSMLDTENSSAGVERTLTDAGGRFAVYGYRAEDFQEGPERLDSTAILSFKHDQYIDVHLESVEKKELSERDQLRVVMQKGRSIGGTVTAPDGAPVPDVAVSIFQEKPHQRRGSRTDSEGRFRFDGVALSDARLRVVDVPGNRKAIVELTVNQSDTDMRVSLTPFASPLETTHQVLGVTLTDISEEIDEAYDLQSRRKTDRGVMIVDPGDRADEFNIGELRPGYVFWMVGNDRIGDLRTMVRQLLKEARSPTVPPGAEGNLSAAPLPGGGASVRVVYTFNDDRGHGTNTQYMKLTLADIVELERVLRSLGPAEEE